MTNKDLTKPNKNKGIAKDEALWLLNLDNGRIFPWTALLAVRKHFIDCTADGVPVNPKDVPGDHPWIRKQTQGLADRMRASGANVDTLQDFGRQLSDDAAAKFKTLAYERAQQLQLEDQKSAAQVGATVRIQNKIDRMVEHAKSDIREMCANALMSHGYSVSEAWRMVHDVR